MLPHLFDEELGHCKNIYLTLALAKNGDGGHMNITHIVLPAILVALAGCSTIQDDVKNNRTATIASCVRQVEMSRPEFKQHAMTYIGVSREHLSDTLCSRLADGVASGRIDQTDLNRLIATGQLNAKFAFLKRR
ncbi:hypothetical protein SAMN05443582_10117 [Phyllobacterium sp. OV277]|nr:hypothetical protein SAMN05443582_10117 [Phyllobacterium sp. OV277]